MFEQGRSTDDDKKKWRKDKERKMDRNYVSFFVLKFIITCFHYIIYWFGSGNMVHINVYKLRQKLSYIILSNIFA